MAWDELLAVYEQGCGNGSLGRHEHVGSDRLLVGYGQVGVNRPVCEH